MIKTYSVNVFPYLLLFGFLISNLLSAQSFNPSGLKSIQIDNPTSLDFGPNGKLYVAQQDGTIYEYTVLRDNAEAGEGTYTAIEAVKINAVKTGVPNHNDNGTINTLKVRQITGLLAAGTVNQPILYVSSSDSRIGGGGSGNDKNLDTNSGILSRLTWTGTTWDKVDLVRGLPRCEENHSTNGMEIFERNGNNYLMLQQGGNANKGAPSNNFAGTPETFLSAAMLIINLTQLEQIEASNGGPFIDARYGNIKYVYDLPTLNDPNRPDIDNSSANFPYNVGHPMYNATIDVGDPFGGNNGLNQAFPEEGGPVQIFSTGWRNGYDVVITKEGRIYSVDNGPNTTWGGLPVIYDSNGQRKGDQGTTTYNPELGDYVTNDLNESGSDGHGDPLHYVGNVSDANGSYYAGHPVPIRAFPSRAGLKVYEFDGEAWVIEEEYDFGNLLTGVSGYFNQVFDITDFPDNPIEGEYLSVSKYDARMRIFDIVNSSTNGMCEYTASNFDGAMKGDILTASFNGKINRYHLNESGDAVSLKNNNFLSGFGSTPLDVIAQGDSDPFPGTIWAATYGADNITVFEPADFGNCLDPSDANYDGTADYDFDGYSNDDELANGTDICSGGSKPSDNDGDFISDLNDPDDDNDGIADVADPFAIDANNGLGTSLPIDYPFWNNDPGTGLFGLGFTGLMISGDGTTDYLTQYDDTNLSFGGAGGKATIDFVDDGSALDGNTQRNGFQFGVNVDSNSSPFTVHSKIETPFANVTSTTNLSYGIFIGNGDQDHYLQISIMDGSLADDGILGFEVVKEDGSPNVYSMVYDVNGLLGATSVDLYINVSPATNEAQPYYSLDGGESVIALGGKITLPVEVLDATDNQGMAVGLISTTGGGEPFTATWDYIRINIDGNANLVLSESPVDFGKLYTDASQVQLVETLKNEGGPSAGVVELSSINITGPDANLFSHDLELPLVLGPGANKTIPINFFPNGIEGIKSASLELVHDGDNSPYVVPLTAILEEYVEPAYTVVARVNAGGEGVLATDDQPDWESNIGNGAVTGITYTVNAGTIPGSTNTFQYENRHESVPDYIDETTFNAIYSKERYDPTSAPEMEFKFPVDNGNYVVNIYTGNGYGPANSVGARIFDISLESQLKGDDIDVVQLFGGSGTQFHAGMLSYDITVADGELNVLFEHTGTENPVLQAIEVLKVNGTNDLISIAQIENQLNFVDDTISLTVSASGGNQNENFTYAISGQPEGVDIEPTNGHIFGVIANGALSGGPNNNGDHQVTITVSKPGSSTENMVFQWSIGNYTWTDKEENESYTARHECSLVQSGDKFYLMGGRENAKTIDVYDYNTDSWKQITNSPPQEFNHFQAVEYKGLIWVIGAFKTNTFPQERPAEYIWAFDPVTEKWIQGAEIPESRRRGSTGLVVYNDKFYISGGNTAGHDGGYVSWLDQYDPSTGQWKVLTDAPRARDHFHAAVIGHKMYLAGGRLSGGQGGVFAPTIEEVDVYDFSQGEWSTLPSQQNIPTPRAAPVTASINGKLIVAGGEVQNQNVYGTVVSGALKITEQYDPETGSWSRLPDLNHHRHGTQAIVSGNGVFVMGGSPNLGGGNQKNMEFLGEDTPTGTANTASQISAPTLVDMNPGETAAIDLQAIEGNMGVYIRSVTLKGDEGGYFTLSTANVKNILLEPNGTLELNVTLSETGANKNAILSIEYATEATLDIVLKNGEYNSGITNPGTQYNRVGEAVSLQIETENMGNNLNFSAVGLPPGLQIDEDNGLISGTIATTGSDGPFLENNGLVVIEAESGDLVPGWTATNVGGATGIKASTNSFNSQNGGTIPYEIKVTTPGVYRFNWRSFYSGENSTEENDNWLKFPNNDDVWFFGYKGAITDEAALINNLQGPQENIVFPKGSSRVTSQTTPEGGGSNGFFKIWRSGGNPEVYDWQARTSDNDSHNVYIWFVNPGTYTMQVSERSAGHAIDKMALYKIDGTNYSDIQLTNASESKRDGIAGSVEENSPYNVTVTVNNNSNTSSTEFNWIIGNSGNPVAILSANKTTGRAPLAVSFTGSQSSDDVAIVDYSWEFGDELSSTSDVADPTFNFLKAGTYTVLLRVKDGDNNIDTNTIEINVLPPLEHTITVSVGQNGSVNPKGNVQVVEGRDQQFIISPNSGYAINEVIVDGVSQGAVESYIFYNVTGDHSLEATFIKKLISIEASAGLGGEISPKGTISIAEGDNQKFTAIAEEGYDFDYFIVDNSFTVSEPEYLFENVSGEHIIKAVFVEKEKPKYLIASSAGFGGFISPVGDNWVEESGSIVFSVTESDGYQFEHFLVDGIVVADMAEYTFENVMEGHSIEAVFKSIQGDYTLNLLASEGGTLDPSGTLYVKEGDTQEVNIIPNEGHQIKQILVDGVEVTIVESYKFENISSSHEMQVIFQKTNEGPSALIRADVKSGYSPLLVNFDGSNSSDDVAITSFTWNFGDGSNTIEGETAAHTYNSVGIYTATLTVEDIEGEISTETIEITVLDSPGLSEEGNKELRIYPNPASSEVSLGLVKGANLILETVSVFDMSGNLVLESDVKNTAVGEVYKVTVANLSDGLYYVRTKDVSGNEMIKRLLVKH